MKKKICIITGANAGIGKEAAIQLIQAGFHVIIACRNVQRGEIALQEIKQRSKSGSVELMMVDMSLQSSINAFASSFLAKYETLDVLIHNAAIFNITAKSRETTAEGIESVWATNHIGPVLLTDLLLGALKRSKQGRIITISSKGLVSFPYLTVNLEDPEFQHRKFNIVKAYYQSKLAQVMYTYWLAKKLEDTAITVNAIRVANVKVDINERFPNTSRFLKFVYALKSKFSLSPVEMAKTYTYLSASDELSTTTGQYFDEHHRQIKSSKYSRNWNNIEKVMALTMKYIGKTTT